MTQHPAQVYNEQDPKNQHSFIPILIFAFIKILYWQPEVYSCGGEYGVLLKLLNFYLSYLKVLIK